MKQPDWRCVMWTDHLWGFSLTIWFTSRSRRSLTQLEPQRWRKRRRKTFQFRLCWQKKKGLKREKKQNKLKAQKLWQVSPPRKKVEKRGRFPKCSFKLRDVHQSVQMGTLGGVGSGGGQPWHIRHPLHTAPLFGGPWKKRQIKVWADEKKPPITPTLPPSFHHFYSFTATLRAPVLAAM